MAERRSLSPFVIVLFLTALSACVFGPALQNPFYFDDIIVLRDNEWLKSVSLPFFWFRSYFIDSTQLFNGYRPTLMWSFWINTRLLGNEPAALRFGNILLHSLNAILLFFFLRSLIRDSSRSFIAWGTATLFLLHPLQTLPINFLWKRSSLLETTFLLLALFLHARERHRNEYRIKILATQIVLYALAFTSKESGLLLPCYFLLVDFLFFGSWNVLRNKRSWVLYGWMLLTALPFLWFRLHVIPEWIAANQGALPNRRFVSRMDYLQQQLVVLPDYVRLWLYPAPLLLDDPHSLTEFPWSGLVTTLSLVLLSITVSLRFRHHPVVPFSIALFWIALSSTSVSPLFLVKDQVRLYLPLAGLSLLLVQTITAIRPLIGRALWMILVVVYALFSVYQNLRYRSPVLIWADVATNYPQSGMAWEGLGSALQEAQQFRQAADAYQRANKVEPGNHIYLVDALYCSYRSGQPPTELLEQAKRISTDLLDVRRMINLAIVEAELGEFDQAEKHFNDAILANPSYGLTYLNLGIFLERRGKKERAFEAYQLAQRLLPGHPIASSGVERLRSSLP